MKSQNRNFKGIWIPRDLWFVKELSIEEKILLLEISSLDNDDGCFASNKHFSELLQVKERQVRKYLETLKDKNLIAHKMLSITKRVIIVTKTGRILMAENDRPGGAVAPATGGAVAPHSNTRESNTISNVPAPKNGAKELAELIDGFRTVDPNWRRLFERMNQRKAMERMIAQHGREALEKIIAFLPRNNADPYAPKITSPIQLEEGLGRMKAHWDQKKNKGVEKNQNKFSFSK